MSRRAAVVLLATLAATVVVAVVLSGPVFGAGRERTVGYGQIKFRGAGPEKWAARYRRARAQVHYLRDELRREHQIVLRAPSVVEAVNLACATYGNCATLWRKASCETGGTFDPRAENASGATGLFQFIESTWKTTPYRDFPRTSPYANALAAGWMHNQGRGGEWSCR